MYYLKRKIKKCKLKSIGNLSGLEIKPRGKAGEQIKSVLLCDKSFSGSYASKQIDKRVSKLCNDIYKILISDDNDENGVKACLGEIEKTKSVIFNKYKEHIKNKEYKEFLAKMVILENEFRDKYLEKQYLASLINKSLDKFYPTYQEEMEKGRSR